MRAVIDRERKIFLTSFVLETVVARARANVNISMMALRLLILPLFPVFIASNVIGATGDEEPVIEYSELCEVCSLRNPFFSLKLFPTGRVVYDGPLLLDKALPFGAIPLEKGQREVKIPQEEVGRWVEMLLDAKFFALEKLYIGTACAERWDRVLILKVEGATHSVRWFWCRETGFPRVLHDVGKQIESKVNPRQWIKILPLEQSPYRPKPRQAQ